MVRAADILDPAALDAALDLAESRGRLRAVVHCAGRGGDRLRILDKEGAPGDIDSFTSVVRTNLIGSYNVLRLAAARMAKNDVADGDRGAIVLTASVAAFDGQVGQTAYSASKAAVHGMTLASAVPHPKRLGDAEDYAHLAVAILENSYLDGETIRLDGAIRMPPR